MVGVVSGVHSSSLADTALESLNIKRLITIKMIKIKMMMILTLEVPHMT